MLSMVIDSLKICITYPSDLHIHTPIHITVPPHMLRHETVKAQLQASYSGWQHKLLNRLWQAGF